MKVVYEPVGMARNGKRRGAQRGNPRSGAKFRIFKTMLIQPGSSRM